MGAGSSSAGGPRRVAPTLRAATGRRFPRLGRFLLVAALAFPAAGAVEAAQWSRTYGGTQYDEAYDVHSTADGGFVVAGQTLSFGTANFHNDGWLLRLDPGGNVAWQKTFGGPGEDFFSAVRPTADGGFVVAGYREPAAYSQAGFDGWVLKLDPGGNVVWQRTYGRPGSDSLGSIEPTADGGYIAAGSLASPLGYWDAWMLKLDAAGNIVWQKSYGGPNLSNEGAAAVKPTDDGGFIVVGSAFPAPGGDYDAWVSKLDGNGNVVWQKTYGGAAEDYATSVQPTADGGFVVAGATASFGAGWFEAWLLKLDAYGNVVWQKTYGGPAYYDVANAIVAAADGGYAVAGFTQSFATAGYDIWVLKIDASGNLVRQRTYGSGGKARAVEPTADGGFVVAGSTWFTVFPGDLNAWVLKLDADLTISGCDIMAVPAAIQTHSSAVAADYPALVVAGIGVTQADPAIVPLNSSAVPQQQCYFAGTVVPTEVPAVSGWQAALLAGLLGLCAAVLMRTDTAGRGATAF